MRRVLVCMFTVLFLLCVSMSAQAVTEEKKLLDALKTGEIIRLHVIAAGDDAENQRIKLCVRDKVLAAFGDQLSNVSTCDDMMGFLEKSKQSLADTALAAARDEGFLGSVTAQVGVFPFPDRWYGSVLLPAGDYNALRIILGSGEGKNWWCVLFPSLCLSLSSSAEPPAALPDACMQDDVQPEFSWTLGQLFSNWPLVSPV